MANDTVVLYRLQSCGAYIELIKKKPSSGIRKKLSYIAFTLIILPSGNFRVNRKMQFFDYCVE